MSPNAGSEIDPKDVLAALEEQCQTTYLAGGGTSREVPVAAVRQICSEQGVSAREVERIALRQGIIPSRYVRNASTLTANDQVRLLESTACVVGVGGLGGWLTEILARAGVGTLRLIDRDNFDDSNLNRQLYSSEPVRGQPKAEVAARRLAGVNSSATVEGHAIELTDKNAIELLSGSDVLIDCLDSIQTRFTLERAATSIGLPIVSAAVAGASGQVMTIMPGGPGFRSIYGPAESAPDHGAELELGTPPFTVATLASLQAAEAIRVLLGRPALYSGRLLLVDLEDGSFNIINLE